MIATGRFKKFLLIFSLALIGLGSLSWQVTQITNAKTETSKALFSTIPFVDELNEYDTALWLKSGIWKNGTPFLNAWRQDHVSLADGVMTLQLDDQPCATPVECDEQPYASGEYQTNEFYSYGCLEGRFKAAQSSGVITSLFTYTGEGDSNPHDEIDVEILGKDTTKVQFNYWANNVQHPTIVDLGFDAAQGFHTYAIEWSANTIKWYVDGALKHTEDGSAGALPTTPGKIMVNLWAVDDDPGAQDWAGVFSYANTPITAEYDLLTFTPNATCPTLPEYDEFSTPASIDLAQNQYNSNTEKATSHADDPQVTNCNLRTGKATVWYTYTHAGADSAISLDTKGSGYDTFLAVWIKDNGNLIPITCNDDANGGKQSSVAFQVTQNTTYYIEIGQPQ